MSAFLSAWTLIVKRSLAHGRLLSGVVLGVILAVALSSSTVLYFQALRGLGLARDLVQIPESERVIQLRLEMNSGSPEDYGEAQRTIDTAAAGTLDWLMREKIRSARSATFYVRRPGEEMPLLDERLRGSFQFLTDAERHVEAVEGRLPQPVRAAKGETPVLEGAISQPVASLFGLKVGDTLLYSPFWEDETAEVSVEIVGVFRPVAEDHQLWQAGVLRLTRQISLTNAVPLLVPEETYFHGMAPLFPKVNTSAGWTLVADVDRLEPWNAETAGAGLAILRTSLEGRYVNFRMETPLERVLEAFQTKLFFLRVPLLVVSLMVVAVVLYYVVLLANLLVERQRGEVALLQSRGASFWQIVLIYAMEGLLLSGLGLAVGPVLAVAGIGLLGLSPALASLSGGEVLSVQLTPEAFQMGLLGAALAFGALLLPAFNAARLGVVHYKQELARPVQAPFYQRYYLDLGFLGVTALLLWQLQNQQSLVVWEGVLDQPTVDQLLLLVPTLFLIALSLLFLRLFPLVLAGLGRLLGGVAPVWFTLGLWELGRNPAHYGRLVLLLMMAAGLGVFVASFGGTLERSYADRAHYRAGSDIRVSSLSLANRWADKPLTESYGSVEGVETASPALRNVGMVLSRPFGGGYTLLAVEPESFGRVSWYRDDFSGASLEELLALLGQRVPELGKALPPESARLSLWVRPLGVDPTTFLWAQVRDGNGRYFLYRLGSLDFDEWRRLEVSLTEPTQQGRPRGVVQPRPAPPLRLMSLSVFQGRREGGLAAGNLLLNSLQATTQGGASVLVEGFDQEGGWGPLRVTNEAARDRVDVSPLSPTGQGSSGLFLWERGSTVTERGLALGLDRTPLPAVASASFLTATGHHVGDMARVTLEGREVLAQIRASVAFFPTLDPQQEEFLILPLGPVLERVNVTRSFFETQPNEVWLQAAASADRTALANTLRSTPFPSSEVVDRAALLAEAQADPLVAAGWGVLLSLAYLTVLLLSVIGFVVHAYVSAQQRRLTFAALRGLGLSVPQLVGLVWFEQLLVLGMGLGLGTWMGGRIGSALLPFLSHTEEGAQVLPPFIIETSWGTVGYTYLGMALLFLVTMGVTVWVFSRLAIARALRMGEG